MRRMKMIQELSFRRWAIVAGSGLLSLLVPVSSAEACFCSMENVERLMNNLKQVKVAALLRVPTHVLEADGKIAVDVKSFNGFYFSSVGLSKSTCYIVPKEGRWMIVISDSNPATGLNSCITYFETLDVKSETLQKLAKLWKHGSSPNPIWSICEKDTECVMQPAITCLSAIAVNRKSQTQAQKWQSKFERESSCEAPAKVKKDSKLRAFCDAGVCALK
jgi:hypothetical protein